MNVNVRRPTENLFWLQNFKVKVITVGIYRVEIFEPDAAVELEISIFRKTVLKNVGYESSATEMTDPAKPSEILFENLTSSV